MGPQKGRCKLGGNLPAMNKEEISGRLIDSNDMVVRRAHLLYSLLQVANLMGHSCNNDDWHEHTQYMAEGEG